MKKRTYTLFLLVIVSVCACCVLSSCNGDNKPLYYTNYEYFGTALNCVLYTDTATKEKFADLADKTLSEISSATDYGDEKSDIGRFNKAAEEEKTEVSKLTFDLVAAAKKVYEATDGAFNPCLFYYVDMWGFTARFDGIYQPKEVYDRERDEEGKLPLPESKYVDGLLGAVDFDKVKCIEEEGKFYLKKDKNGSVTIDGKVFGLKLDLGGAVKGYAVDILTGYADGLGIKYGYISYGSSSLRLFGYPDGEWDLSLTNPRLDDTANGESTSYAGDEVANVNVSSSGDYEKYYEIDGKRYCHIIDGKTGKPIDNGICAATVIGGSALYADMLSTALCVMGKDAALTFLKSEFFTSEGRQGCFVMKEGEDYSVYSTIDSLSSDNGHYKVFYV